MTDKVDPRLSILGIAGFPSAVLISGTADLPDG